MKTKGAKTRTYSVRVDIVVDEVRLGEFKRLKLAKTQPGDEHDYEYLMIGTAAAITGWAFTHGYTQVKFHPEQVGEVL